MAEPAAGGEAAGSGAPDPSMEDILASIRRILNEEEAVAPETPGAAVAGGAGQHGGAARPVATPARDADDPDILELDHSMMLPDVDPPFTSHGPVPEPPPVQASEFLRAGEPVDGSPLHEPLGGHEPSGTAPSGHGPPVTSHGADEVAEPPSAHGITVSTEASGAPAEHLVAPAAAAAAASSVGALVRTLARERSTQVSRGGPTIEDLVREEIRPILKDWLDNHLPPMVERLVRAEIERVVGRMT